MLKYFLRFLILMTELFQPLYLYADYLLVIWDFFPCPFFVTLKSCGYLIKLHILFTFYLSSYLYESDPVVLYISRRVPAASLA